jgi:hypothetical protein
MKTSAFIVAAIVIATVLAGSGCSGLPLTVIALQILVALVGFSGILEWKWALTLDIWIWTVTPATLFVSALYNQKAFVHFAIHAVVLIAKIFVFASIVAG